MEKSISYAYKFINLFTEADYLNDIKNVYLYFNDELVIGFNPHLDYGGTIIDTSKLGPEFLQSSYIERIECVDLNNENKYILCIYIKSTNEAMIGSNITVEVIKDIFKNWEITISSKHDKALEDHYKVDFITITKGKVIVELY